MTVLFAGEGTGMRLVFRQGSFPAPEAAAFSREMRAAMLDGLGTCLGGARA